MTNIANMKLHIKTKEIQIQHFKNEIALRFGDKESPVKKARLAHIEDLENEIDQLYKNLKREDELQPVVNAPERLYQECACDGSHCNSDCSCMDCCA